MKGDFSRNSFDPKKQYNSVRMQQGRVQLDSDWNEQMDIIDDRYRHFTEDFLGVAVGPSEGAGFEVTPTSDGSNLNIGAGRYYVNGLMLQIDKDENGNDYTFTTQPDYPDATLPPAERTYLAYLEVWQQSVSAADDPSIAETALGGADTAVRFRNIAQVKLLKADTRDIAAPSPSSPYTYSELFDSKATSGAPHDNWQNWSAITSRLQLDTISQLRPSVDSENATLQNQLYRIEIHQGSKDSDDNSTTPTFKWSRDNAAVSSRITNISGEELTVATMPQDGLTGFNENQWLELTTPARELTGQPGDMVKITSVSGLKLMVSGTISQDIIDRADHDADAIARRWDTATSSANAVKSVNSTSPIAIENGLSVTFSGSDFKTGDYWLIPARAATNSIEWPKDDDPSQGFKKQMPQGIQRFYAPLAILTRTNTSWTKESDSRTLATPMADLNIKVIGADDMAPPSTIYVDGSGQVGIGTTTPQAQLGVKSTRGTALQVEGKAIIQGDLTIDHANKGSLKWVDNSPSELNITNSNVPLFNVPFFIRGTGRLNDSTSSQCFLNIGGKKVAIAISNTEADTKRGLTLAIISKSDLQLSSSDPNPKTYDTWNDPNHIQALAKKLNNLTNKQIGILFSADAWVPENTAVATAIVEGTTTTVMDYLVEAFKNRGLYKAAAFFHVAPNTPVAQSPYAAIFEGGYDSDKATLVPTNKAVEILQINVFDPNPESKHRPAPFADINGWFMQTEDEDYSFTSGSSDPNVIEAAPNAPSDSIYIDSSGQVGIGTTTPQAQLGVKSTSGTALQVEGKAIIQGDLTIDHANKGSLKWVDNSPSELNITNSNVPLFNVPFFIRGTGRLNDSTSSQCFLNIGGKKVAIAISNTEADTKRGLTLAIISKSDLQLSSSDPNPKTYDTWGNSDHIQELAEKLNQLKNTEVGVLFSADAWIPKNTAVATAIVEGTTTTVMDYLVEAFKNRGLYKAAAFFHVAPNTPVAQSPYAAIFEGGYDSDKATHVPTNKAIEILQINVSDPNFNSDSKDEPKHRPAPSADINGWFMQTENQDYSFTSGTNSNFISAGLSSPLRIIRGSVYVNGNDPSVKGTNNSKTDTSNTWSVARIDQNFPGFYKISFIQKFSSRPTVVATAMQKFIHDGDGSTSIGGITVACSIIGIYTDSVYIATTEGGAHDPQNGIDFEFIVIGPA